MRFSVLILFLAFLVIPSQAMDPRPLILLPVQDLAGIDSLSLQAMQVTLDRNFQNLAEFRVLPTTLAEQANQGPCALDCAVEKGTANSADFAVISILSPSQTNGYKLTLDMVNVGTGRIVQRETIQLLAQDVDSQLENVALGTKLFEGSSQLSSGAAGIEGQEDDPVARWANVAIWTGVFSVAFLVAYAFLF